MKLNYFGHVKWVLSAFSVIAMATAVAVDVPGNCIPCQKGMCKNKETSANMEALHDTMPSLLCPGVFYAHLLGVQLSTCWSAVFTHYIYH